MPYDPALAYGPGKPKLPFSLAKAVAAVAPKPKSAPKAADHGVSALYDALQNQMHGGAAYQQYQKAAYQQFVYGYQSSPSFAHGDYGKVGRALGFTENEIGALVECNDSRVPFTVIADLIEAHPVVYSSARTPRRLGEEADFLVRCSEARAQYGRKKSYWTSADLLFYDTADALVQTWYGAGPFDFVDYAAQPQPSALWTPKTGATAAQSLASYLGIWTPAKPNPYDGIASMYGNLTWKQANVSLSIDL